MFAKQN